MRTRLSNGRKEGFIVGGEKRDDDHGECKEGTANQVARMVETPAPDEACVLEARAQGGAALHCARGTVADPLRLRSVTIAIRPWEGQNEIQINLSGPRGTREEAGIRPGSYCRLWAMRQKISPDARPCGNRSPKVTDSLCTGITRSRKLPLIWACTPSPSRRYASPDRSGISPRADAPSPILGSRLPTILSIR